MTHNEMVHGLCTQETITVQDFAELIRFTLDANEEVIYDGWINVYVPIWFDADKAFGLDLNSEENADWINMYIDWHPDNTIHAYVSYCNSSTDDPDFTLEVIMSPHHRELFNAYTDDGKEQDEIEFESVIFADGMHMDVRCIPRHNGPSWCEAAIYREDEDIVTSEPSNSFYNHWVCQTANATYHLYMGIDDE